MRFEKVEISTGGWSVISNCYHCGTRIDGRRIDPDGAIFADLDGPAFEAYYCRPCKESEEK